MKSYDDVICVAILIMNNSNNTWLLKLSLAAWKWRNGKRNSMAHYATHRTYLFAKTAAQAVAAAVCTTRSQWQANPANWQRERERERRGCGQLFCRERKISKRHTLHGTLLNIRGERATIITEFYWYIIVCVPLPAGIINKQNNMSQSFSVSL